MNQTLENTIFNRRPVTKNGTIPDVSVALAYYWSLFSRPYGYQADGFKLVDTQPRRHSASKAKAFMDTMVVFTECSEMSLVTRCQLVSAEFLVDCYDSLEKGIAATTHPYAYTLEAFSNWYKNKVNPLRNKASRTVELKEKHTKHLAAPELDEMEELELIVLGEIANIIRTGTDQEQWIARLFSPIRRATVQQTAEHLGVSVRQVERLRAKMVESIKATILEAVNV